MMTEELKSATRNGVTLRYLEAGTGAPPLLFIHGWCCNSTFWRDQLPHFARKHHVVAMDLRGHGRSDKPDEDYSIPAFVDDVAWLIGELHLHKPVVIGHSMGGTIAMNLARKHPDLVEAIVMVDSPIHPFPDTMQPMLTQTLAALQTPAYEGVAAGFVRMAMFNADSPPLLVEEVVAGMSSAPQRVMHTAIASTLSDESMLAGAIPVPALFIRAATQIASDAELRRRYPGIGVITIPAAHFVQMEQPDATNNVISDFLDKLE